VQGSFKSAYERPLARPDKPVRRSAGKRFSSRQFVRKLQRSHLPPSVWLQWSLLIAMVPLGQLGAIELVGGEVPNLVARAALLLSVLGMLIIYPFYGILRKMRSAASSLLFLTLGWSTVTLAVALALAFLGLPGATESPTLAVWAVAVLVGQLVTIAVGRWIFERLSVKPVNQTPVLVVGNGALAQKLVRALTVNPYLSDKIVGLLVDDQSAVQDLVSRRVLGDDIRLIDSLEKLVLVSRQLLVERVYIAVPFSQTHRVAEIQKKLADLNVDVVWAPDVQAVNALNPTLREIAGLPLVSLSESPINCVASAYSKSLLDVVVGGLALILCAPVMLAAALAIKLTSPGPIIFRQSRHGWDGGVFQIWKFRSMYCRPEEGGRLVQAKVGDNRVTPVGRFLRRSSIDELPQLFNVLRGEMSLVGPRPHEVNQNRDYAKLIVAYMARHRIKPGITGLAQIGGLRGETDTLEKMKDRVELDLRYINGWSIWLDLWILLKTPFALLSHRNVY